MRRSLLVCLLLLASCLAYHAVTAATTVHWNAVGDDATTGTATSYALVYSTDSLKIVQSDAGLNGWSPVAGVTLITSGLPGPGAPGTTEQFALTGLVGNTTYFLSIKAVDEAGNYGALGNILRVLTPDNIAPAAIATLRLAR